MIKKIALIALLVSSHAALADSYKCVDHEGKVSFSFAPCPTWEGDSSLYSQTTATNLTNVDAASADVVRRQLRAAKITRQTRLSTGGPRSNDVVVIPDNTSSLGIKEQQNEARAKRRAQRDARIAAGIQEEPRRPRAVMVNCNSAGNQTYCNDSTGGRSVTNNFGPNSTTTVYSGR
ncbi:DUF4124 domain-containing protein [Pseudomonas sp. Pseusp122]|uniref:DUF4124 domain-containing protein n=1 Tax=unclassified Pseudomonas TaxID=196821 RepID=UPI0039A6F696